MFNLVQSTFCKDFEICICIRAISSLEVCRPRGIDLLLQVHARLSNGSQNCDARLVGNENMHLNDYVIIQNYVKSKTLISQTFVYYLVINARFRP